MRFAAHKCGRCSPKRSSPRGGPTMTRLRLIGVAATLILGGLLSASMVCGSELRSSYAAPPPAPEYHNPLREAMRVDLDVLVDGQPVKLIPYEGRLYLPDR